MRSSDLQPQQDEIDECDGNRAADMCTIATGKAAEEINKVHVDHEKKLCRIFNMNRRGDGGRINVLGDWALSVWTCLTRPGAA